MKKLLPVVIAVLAGYWLLGQNPFGNRSVAPAASDSSAGASAPGPSRRDDNRILAEAFEQRRGNLQIQATGVVARVNPQQTVLIAHNIDLAPRIDEIKAGDAIAFSGEYEWNAQGGVIHWTHRDPAGQHVTGWLEVAGKRYD